MAYPNPLLPAYSAIWTILEANTEFAEAVPLGCRLKNLDGLGDPLKHAGQAADFPSTIVEPREGLFVNDYDSDGANIVKVFDIKVATGRRKIEDMLDMEWIVFAAMRDWETTMTALEWPSGTAGYIKHCRIHSMDENMKAREIERMEGRYSNTAIHSRAGWGLVWTGEIWMYMDRSAIVTLPRT